MSSAVEIHGGWYFRTDFSWLFASLGPLSPARSRFCCALYSRQYQYPRHDGCALLSRTLRRCPF